MQNLYLGIIVILSVSIIIFVIVKYSKKNESFWHGRGGWGRGWRGGPIGWRGNWGRGPIGYNYYPSIPVYNNSACMDNCCDYSDCQNNKGCTWLSLDKQRKYSGSVDECRDYKHCLRSQDEKVCSKDLKRY
jgi:hypothetical protein